MYCGCIDSKVIDSRSAEDGTIIRRRRECIKCGKRFTTYETVENTPIFVIKSNGARQAFDLNKLKTGIIKACEKRPVSAVDIDRLADDIQKKVYNSLAQEVTSKELGEMVCEGLKEIDEVAYVRFASVYRSFTDTTSFMKELEKMVKKDKTKK
jgi:transcriptional repressor NrdR